jgi:hypothetical protein
LFLIDGRRRKQKKESQGSAKAPTEWPDWFNFRLLVNFSTLCIFCVYFANVKKYLLHLLSSM